MATLCIPAAMTEKSLLGALFKKGLFVELQGLQSSESLQHQRLRELILQLPSRSQALPGQPSASGYVPLVTVLGHCSRQDFSNGRTLPCSLCWVGKTLSDVHCGLRLSHSRSFRPLLIFAGVSISPPHLTLSQFSSVQSLSRVQLFVTPWMAACQASLSIANSRSLPKLMSIQAVMPSSHLILCRPLLLLPPIFPSIRVFSNESALCIRWPKYWSFSFSISPHPR